MGWTPAYPQNLPAWDSLTDAQRDLEDLCMATYAAMVERMDRGIGRVMEALRQSGKADNTLVFVLSDNGADSFSVVDEAMLKRGLLPGDRGSNWQLGTGWAYASVTPSRLYKISQHGGSVTTGAIAGGAGVKGKAGRIESSPIHMVDVMPTFLDAIGTRVADTAGESFLPLLRGDRRQRKAPLFFQYMGHRAIRTADWTLAEADGAGWELFDAKRNPQETKNLATENAAAVADLDTRWLAWWREQSGHATYEPESAKGSPHYKPQGDRGSGERYSPSAMPAVLKDRMPVPRQAR